MGVRDRDRVRVGVRLGLELGLELGYIALTRMRTVTLTPSLTLAQNLEGCVFQLPSSLFNNR